TTQIVYHVRKAHCQGFHLPSKQTKLEARGETGRVQSSTLRVAKVTARAA
ncbi:hypothetical protein LINPERHAP1_LOCUS28659, partial [Linum perenne]